MLHLIAGLAIVGGTLAVAAPAHAVAEIEHGTFVAQNATEPPPSGLSCFQVSTFICDMWFESDSCTATVGGAVATCDASWGSGSNRYRTRGTQAANGTSCTTTSAADAPSDNRPPFLIRTVTLGTVAVFPSLVAYSGTAAAGSGAYEGTALIGTVQVVVQGTLTVTANGCGRDSVLFVGTYDVNA